MIRHLAILAALTWAGCASSPAPTARMESTTGVIRAAEEVGARRVPQAGLHLQLALEQSQHAKELIASGEKQQAAALLMRAEADAELALALARQSAMHTEALAAVERVRTLKQSAQ